MCWICATDKLQLGQNYVASLVPTHFQRPGTTDSTAIVTAAGSDGLGITGKYYDAFPVDGVGDFKPITINTVLLLTPDAIADDTSTTTTITVDGPAIVSTIDSIGDQDFFRVDLVAGQIYHIGQYLVVGGPERGAAVRRLHRALRRDRPSDDQCRRRRTQHAVGAGRAADLHPRSQRHLLHQRPRLRPGRHQRHRRRRSRRLPIVRHRCHRPADLRPYTTSTARCTRSTGAPRSTAPRATPTATKGRAITGDAFTGVANNPYGIVGKNVITYYFAKTGDVFVDEDPPTPA